MQKNVEIEDLNKNIKIFLMILPIIKMKKKLLPKEIQKH